MPTVTGPVAGSTRSIHFNSTQKRLTLCSVSQNLKHVSQNWKKIVKKQDTKLEVANREHQRLRDKLNQSERKRLEPPAAVTLKRMVGIKFKALFDGKYQPTEFKIGLGKCGKVVNYFEVTKREDRTLTIHQYHTDGSSKDFEYRLGDIDGRIQYDYELMQVYGEEAERERAIKAFM